MDIQTLQQLGISVESLQERVIDQICDRLLRNSHEDEDGLSFFGKYELHEKLNAEIKKRIDETVNALAEKHILPNVSKYVEELTLQKTNQWGEKVGGPVSFIEYLVGRATGYMQEQVSYEGKTKGEANGYSWHGTQTRITFLIEKHLHHSIEKAMKDALNIATGEIARGIHETARVKLNEIAASLQVAVKTK